MIGALHRLLNVAGPAMTAGCFLVVSACNPAVDLIADAPAPEELEPFDPDSLQLYYTLTLEQARNLLKNNRDEIIIDIRSPEEFAISHIPGAYNYEMESDEFMVAIAEIEKDLKILVYSDHVPGKTDEALNRMRGLGFRNVYQMIGGITAWIEAGHPVVRDIPEPTGPAKPPKPAQPTLVVPPSPGS